MPFIYRKMAVRYQKAEWWGTLGPRTHQNHTKSMCYQMKLDRDLKIQYQKSNQGNLAVEFEIVINFSLRLNNRLENNTWFYKTDITSVSCYTTHIKNICMESAFILLKYVKLVNFENYYWKNWAKANGKDRTQHWY